MGRTSYWDKHPGSILFAKEITGEHELTISDLAQNLFLKYGEEINKPTIAKMVKEQDIVLLDGRLARGRAPVIVTEKKKFDNSGVGIYGSSSDTLNGSGFSSTYEGKRLSHGREDEISDIEILGIPIYDSDTTTSVRYSNLLETIKSEISTLGYCLSRTLTKSAVTSIRDLDSQLTKDLNSSVVDPLLTLSTFQESYSLVRDALPRDRSGRIIIGNSSLDQALDEINQYGVLSDYL